MPHSNSHLPALEGRTLLDEFNHRIKNELNLVSFKAIWTDNIDAKEELRAVAALAASPMNRANGTARFRASANCRTGSINSIEGRHADRQMLPDAILARYGKARCLIKSRTQSATITL